MPNIASWIGAIGRYAPRPLASDREAKSQVMAGGGSQRQLSRKKINAAPGNMPESPSYTNQQDLNSGFTPNEARGARMTTMPNMNGMATDLPAPEGGMVQGMPMANLDYGSVQPPLLGDSRPSRAPSPLRLQAQEIGDENSIYENIQTPAYLDPEQERQKALAARGTGQKILDTFLGVLGSGVMGGVEGFRGTATANAAIDRANRTNKTMEAGFEDTMAIRRAQQDERNARLMRQIQLENAARAEEQMYMNQDERAASEAARREDREWRRQEAEKSQGRWEKDFGLRESAEQRLRERADQPDYRTGFDDYGREYVTEITPGGGVKTTFTGFRRGERYGGSTPPNPYKDVPQLQDKDLQLEAEKAADSWLEQAAMEQGIAAAQAAAQQRLADPKQQPGLYDRYVRGRQAPTSLTPEERDELIREETELAREKLKKSEAYRRMVQEKWQELYRRNLEQRGKRIPSLQE